MTASGQLQTHAPQQRLRYSMTALALASNVGGMAKRFAYKQSFQISAPLTVGEKIVAHQSETLCRSLMLRQ